MATKKHPGAACTHWTHTAACNSVSPSRHTRSPRVAPDESGANKPHTTTTQKAPRTPRRTITHPPSPQAARARTLLVVGNNALGNGLANSVDLGSVATTADTNAHVHPRKPLLAEQKQGFKHLHPEDLGLQQLDGAPVDLHQTLAIALDERDSNGGLLRSRAEPRSH